MPQLTHDAYPNMQMGQNNYKQFPSSVTQVVAVIHHQQHYAVMEITIATQTITVFDGLSCLHLD
jgi:hypothetical protein